MGRPSRDKGKFTKSPASFQLGAGLFTITLDTYSHMLPGMGGEAPYAMEVALPD